MSSNKKPDRVAMYWHDECESPPEHDDTGGYSADVFVPLGPWTPVHMTAIHHPDRGVDALYFMWCRPLRKKRRPRSVGPFTDQHDITGSADPGVLFWVVFVAFCAALAALISTLGPLDPLGVLDSAPMTTTQDHP